MTTHEKVDDRRMSAQERSEVKRKRAHINQKFSAAIKAKDLVESQRELKALRALPEVVGAANSVKNVYNRLFHLMQQLADEASERQDKSAGENIAEQMVIMWRDATAKPHPEGLEKSENGFTQVMKVCCAAGQLSTARDFFQEMLDAKIPPRTRTISALLKCATKEKKLSDVLELFDLIGKHNLETTEQEFQYVFEALSSCSIDDEAVASQRADLVDKYLSKLSSVSFSITSESLLDVWTANLKDHIFKSVQWCDVDQSNGLVAQTEEKLRSIDLPPNEIVDMMSFVERLATEANGRGMDEMKSFLENRESFDVIIDAANVGHHGQNFAEGEFSYDQIDKIAAFYEAQNKRALVILHPKWLDPYQDLAVSVTKKRKRRKFGQLGEADKNRTAATGENAGTEYYRQSRELSNDPNVRQDPDRVNKFKADWSAKECLVEVPWDSNDDWYWLYAALDAQRRTGDVVVVSNDLMRDHHWRMFTRSDFLCWRERHLTRYHVFVDREAEGQPMELKVFPPPPFSERMQQSSSDPRRWYVPVFCPPEEVPATDQNPPAAVKDGPASDEKPSEDTNSPRKRPASAPIAPTDFKMAPVEEELRPKFRWLCISDSTPAHLVDQSQSQ